MGRKSCADIGLDYTVHGLQYLPDKSHQMGEHFKRTLIRMSHRVRGHRNGSSSTKPDIQNTIKPQDQESDGSRTTEVGIEIEHIEHHPPGNDTGKGLSGHNNNKLEKSNTTRPTIGTSSEQLEQQNGTSLTIVGEIDSKNYPFPYENIVMSGGGSKGYAFIGALKALEDSGILSRVRRVGGSSAGSICAGLLAVGCSPQEIADVFFCNVKWLFQDQSCGCFMFLPKMLNNYGINPGIRFQEIYGNHIAKKVGNPDITFLELYKDYDRELCVVVTNLSRMCSEYCHWTTTPDLPIRKAVRMSMSYPLLFEPVTTNLTGEEDVYTDGGALDQFPIHCFDGPLLELNHNTETGKKRCMNNKTIGINLFSECPVDYKAWQSLYGCQLPNRPSYLPNTKLAKSILKAEIKRRERADETFDASKFVKALKADPVLVGGRPMMRHYDIRDAQKLDLSTFKHYFKANMSTMFVSQQRLHVKPEDITRTVPVNTGYISTIVPDVEPADREFLIRCGYEQTQKFLLDYISRQNRENEVQTNLRKASKLNSEPISHTPQIPCCVANIARSISEVSSSSSKETQV